MSEKLRDRAGCRVISRVNVRRVSRPVLAESLESRRLMVATPGTLDSSFNGSGLAVPSGGAGYFATAVQTDGKILAVGYINTGTLDVFLARYNANGTLDSTFGTGGKVTTDIAGASQIGTSVHLQADGKILVLAASTQFLEQRSNSWVLRYTAGGHLDTTFATGGIYTSTDRLSTFALQGDGKILAVGTTSTTTSGSVAKGIIDRFTTGGHFDTTFGTAGQTTITLGTNAATDSALLRDVAVTSDGGIIVSGSKGVASVVGDTSGDYVTLKLTDKGTLDTGFGTNHTGIVVTNVADSDIEAAQVLLPNGKILVAGQSHRWLSTVDTSMVRYNANGTLDTTFNGTGKKLIGIYTGGQPTGTGSSVTLAVQSDGKIISSSFLTTSGGFGSTLARLNNDGSFDTSFGTSGKVNTNGIGFYNGLALQADGKIVQAGSAVAGGASLARWLGSTTVGASIAGNLFNDADADGIKDTGETNFAGWTVYIDKDKTGSYVSTDPATVTDPNGNFSFSNLAAGTYRVRVLPQAGYRGTTPASGYVDITVSTGQQITGKSFGYTSQALVTGRVFNDANSNKVQDSTETGLANWRVFLDVNKDGKFETTEPSALTDSTGNYAINDVTPGTYLIGEVPQNGWTQTTPSTPFSTIVVPGGSLFSAKPIGNHQGVALPAVSVTAIDPTATEAALSSGTFKFTRTGSAAASLTIKYTLSSGTGYAVNGTDYTSLTGTLTFAAGSLVAYLLVKPTGHALLAASELVKLTLGTGTGYVLGDTTSATVTIVQG